MSETVYSRSVEDLAMLADAFQLVDDEPISNRKFELAGAKIAICKTHVWLQAGECEYTHLSEDVIQWIEDRCSG